MTKEMVIPNTVLTKCVEAVNALACACVEEVSENEKATELFTAKKTQDTGRNIFVKMRATYMWLSCPGGDEPGHSSGT